MTAPAELVHLNMMKLYISSPYSRERTYANPMFYTERVENHVNLILIIIIIIIIVKIIIMVLPTNVKEISSLLYVTSLCLTRASVIIDGPVHTTNVSTAGQDVLLLWSRGNGLL